MAYVKMQPYSVSGEKPHTYTVILDLNNSNPATWATYEDEAIGMTVGSDDWDTFFGHYPCILDSGFELGKLNRNNFAQYENGTSAPITTLGKDVMIALPRRGIKIQYIDTNKTLLSVSMTNEENKTGYSYMAHSYKGNVCDKFYLGAYKGYISGNKLYSVSGQIPTTNYNISQYRNYAQARGTGYEQSAFYQLTFRQVMYLLKYKGQNPQIAIGMGYSATNSSNRLNTGNTNTRGMDWGETTGKLQMCLFGIEDFYGHIYEFIDGVGTNSSRQVLLADGNYNNNLTGYIISSSAISSNTDGSVKHVIGTNSCGFLCDSTNYGNSSTYFCDSGGLANSKIGAMMGGSMTNYSANGVFNVFLYRTATQISGNYGARLMYMHVA